MGDIDTQALAGAVATGTHGTGIALPSLSASLQAARLVTASGDVLEVGGGDPELLRAARVSMGMLGVMAELTLELTDAYVLHERLSYVELEELVERYDELLHAHRHFSFFYFPSERSAALYGDATTAPAPGTSKRDDVCSLKLMDLLPADTEPGLPGLGERVDRMYRICPSVFEPNFHEMEYMLPSRTASRRCSSCVSCCGRAVATRSTRSSAVSLPATTACSHRSAAETPRSSPSQASRGPTTGRSCATVTRSSETTAAGPTGASSTS